jgi:hypothetical protein
MKLNVFLRARGRLSCRALQISLWVNSTFTFNIVDAALVLISPFESKGIYKNLCYITFIVALVIIRE